MENSPVSLDVRYLQYHRGANPPCGVAPKNKKNKNGKERKIWAENFEDVCVFLSFQGRLGFFFKFRGRLGKLFWFSRTFWIFFKFRGRFVAGHFRGRRTFN